MTKAILNSEFHGVPAGTELVIIRQFTDWQDVEVLVVERADGQLLPTMGSPHRSTNVAASLVTIVEAKPVKLTASQAEVMHHYSDRVGETFDVLCGYLTNAVNPEFKPFGPPTTIATLRGLETKGLIRIVDSFWKGATITVLKAA